MENLLSTAIASLKTLDKPASVVDNRLKLLEDTLKDPKNSKFGKFLNELNEKSAKDLSRNFSQKGELSTPSSKATTQDKPQDNSKTQENSKSTNKFIDWLVEVGERGTLFGSKGKKETEEVTSSKTDKKTDYSNGLVQNNKSNVETASNFKSEKASEGILNWLTKVGERGTLFSKNELKPQSVDSSRDDLSSDNISKLGVIDSIKNTQKEIQNSFTPSKSGVALQQDVFAKDSSSISSVDTSNISNTLSKFIEQSKTKSDANAPEPSLQQDVFEKEDFNPKIFHTLESIDKTTKNILLAIKEGGKLTSPNLKAAVEEKKPSNPPLPSLPSLPIPFSLNEAEREAAKKAAAEAEKKTVNEVEKKTVNEVEKETAEKAAKQAEKETAEKAAKQAEQKATEQLERNTVKQAEKEAAQKVIGEEAKTTVKEVAQKGVSATVATGAKDSTETVAKEVASKVEQSGLTASKEIAALSTQGVKDANTALVDAAKETAAEAGKEGVKTSMKKALLKGAGKGLLVGAALGATEVGLDYFGKKQEEEGNERTGRAMTSVAAGMHTTMAPGLYVAGASAGGALLTAAAAGSLGATTAGVATALGAASAGAALTAAAAVAAPVLVAAGVYTAAVKFGTPEAVKAGEWLGDKWAEWTTSDSEKYPELGMYRERIASGKTSKAQVAKMLIGNIKVLKSDKEKKTYTELAIRALGEDIFSFFDAEADAKMQKEKKEKAKKEASIKEAPTQPPATGEVDIKDVESQANSEKEAASPQQVTSTPSNIEQTQGDVEPTITTLATVAQSAVQGGTESEALSPEAREAIATTTSDTSETSSQTPSLPSNTTVNVTQNKESTSIPTSITTPSVTVIADKTSSNIKEAVSGSTNSTQGKASSQSTVTASAEQSSSNVKKAIGDADGAEISPEDVGTPEEDSQPTNSSEQEGATSEESSNNTEQLTDNVSKTPEPSVTTAAEQSTDTVKEAVEGSESTEGVSSEEGTSDIAAEGNTEVEATDEITSPSTVQVSEGTKEIAETTAMSSGKPRRGATSQKSTSITTPSVIVNAQQVTSNIKGSVNSGKVNTTVPTVASAAEQSTDSVKEAVTPTVEVDEGTEVQPTTDLEVDEGAEVQPTTDIQVDEGTEVQPEAALSTTTAVAEQSTDNVKEEVQDKLKVPSAKEGDKEQQYKEWRDKGYKNLNDIPKEELEAFREKYRTKALPKAYADRSLDISIGLGINPTAKRTKTVTTTGAATPKEESTVPTTSSEPVKESVVTATEISKVESPSIETDSKASETSVVETATNSSDKIKEAIIPPLTFSEWYAKYVSADQQKQLSADEVRSIELSYKQLGSKYAEKKLNRFLSEHPPQLPTVEEPSIKTTEESKDIVDTSAPPVSPLPVEASPATTEDNIDDEEQTEDIEDTELSSEEDIDDTIQPSVVSSAAQSTDTVKEEVSAAPTQPEPTKEEVIENTPGLKQIMDELRGEYVPKETTAKLNYIEALGGVDLQKFVDKSGARTAGSVGRSKDRLRKTLDKEYKRTTPPLTYLKSSEEQDSEEQTSNTEEGSDEQELDMSMPDMSMPDLDMSMSDFTLKLNDKPSEVIEPQKENSLLSEEFYKPPALLATPSVVDSAASASQATDDIQKNTTKKKTKFSEWAEKRLNPGLLKQVSPMDLKSLETDFNVFGGAHAAKSFDILCNAHGFESDEQANTSPEAVQGMRAASETSAVPSAEGNSEEVTSDTLTTPSITPESEEIGSQESSGGFSGLGKMASLGTASIFKSIPSLSSLFSDIIQTPKEAEATPTANAVESPQVDSSSNIEAALQKVAASIDTSNKNDSDIAAGLMKMAEALVSAGLMQSPPPSIVNVMSGGNEQPGPSLANQLSKSPDLIRTVRREFAV